MIFNGFVIVDYEVDFGNLFFFDWGYIEVFYFWSIVVKGGRFFMFEIGFINGINIIIFNCNFVIDVCCVGQGVKYEIIFKENIIYFICFVNLVVDLVFDFSIDQYDLIVIV